MPSIGNSVGHYHPLTDEENDLLTFTGQAVSGDGFGGKFTPSPCFPRCLVLNTEHLYFFSGLDRAVSIKLKNTLSLVHTIFFIGGNEQIQTPEVLQPPRESRVHRDLTWSQ